MNALFFYCFILNKIILIRILDFVLKFHHSNLLH